MIDTGWLPSYIADYGLPLTVLVWTALTYDLTGNVPHGVPRRLVCPFPWDPQPLYHWTVVKVLIVRFSARLVIISFLAFALHL